MLSGNLILSYNFPLRRCIKPEFSTKELFSTIFGLKDITMTNAMCNTHELEVWTGKKLIVFNDKKYDIPLRFVIENSKRGRYILEWYPVSGGKIPSSIKSKTEELFTIGKGFYISELYLREGPIRYKVYNIFGIFQKSFNYFREALDYLHKRDATWEALLMNCFYFPPKK